MAHLLSSDSDTAPIAADEDEILSSSSGEDDGDGDSSAPDDFELDAAVGEARAYSWGRKTVLRAGRGQSWEKPALGDEVSVEWAKIADGDEPADALEAMARRTEAAHTAEKLNAKYDALMANLEGRVVSNSTS